MIQTIEYKADITIPNNLVLIERKEYEDLKSAGFKGNCISVEDFLKKHISMSRQRFMSLVLLNPKFRPILDVKLNPNGCVVYPKSVNAGKYYILESKLVDFIENNFSKIFCEEKKKNV